MRKPHFDEALKVWTARKHKILEEYLPTFFRALSKHGSIYYVDGYAGAGIYQDRNNPTTPPSYGSPVLAANIAQKFSPNVYCINVEEDQENFTSLVQQTRIFPYVLNLPGDFKDKVDIIVGHINDASAFFFLDSFGAKELPMTGIVDRIVKRAGKTDILLRYATEAVRRLAGSYEKDKRNGAANARNLDNWFAGFGWRQIIEQYPAGPQRDEHLLDHYMQQLVSISRGKIKCAKSYPIRDIDGSIKYHLVFASGDRLGAKLMSDILYLADTKFTQENIQYQEARRIAQLNGQLELDVTSPVSVNTQQTHLESIEKAILQVARRGQKHWNFDDLRNELILNQGWFARFSCAEFRAVCKGLHAGGRIQRVSTGRAWNDETIFTIVPNP